ncbi:MAG: Nif3-like dinuclear metal center hexameric protein [Clostridia bacterium]|nr:Nif3-like dinuclear metal center hexameric protein [Clostridia bacterium]
MTAKELMTALIGKEPRPEETVDTCKWGDPDRVVRKVATCLTPTPEVLRACSEWGGDLLITHEPCVYDHLDVPRNDPVTGRKLELLSAGGFTIWRYHDYIHHTPGRPDGIHNGFLSKLGLTGEYDGSRYFCPSSPLTPRQVALLAEKAGLTKHARIAGDPDLPVKKIALFLGAVGGMADGFLSTDADLAVLGEICEWRNVEQIRDAAQLGIGKAYVVLGHCASEWPGMEELADRLRTDYPFLETVFLPCGDIYSFTDS